MEIELKMETKDKYRDNRTGSLSWWWPIWLHGLKKIEQIQTNAQCVPQYSTISDEWHFCTERLLNSFRMWLRTNNEQHQKHRSIHWFCVYDNSAISTTSKWQSNEMHKPDAILQKIYHIKHSCHICISNIIYRIINLDSCLMFFALSGDVHQHFEWNYITSIPICNWCELMKIKN